MTYVIEKRYECFNCMLAQDYRKIKRNIIKILLKILSIKRRPVSRTPFLLWYVLSTDYNY